MIVVTGFAKVNAIENLQYSLIKDATLNRIDFDCEFDDKTVNGLLYVIADTIPLKKDDTFEFSVLDKLVLKIGEETYEYDKYQLLEGLSTPIPITKTK